jgi:8-oxo-dGTP diphosphatase
VNCLRVSAWLRRDSIEGMIEISAVILVDRAGRILLQLRDEHAPYHPSVWGLPGGHAEPGESPLEGAAMVFTDPPRILDGRPYTPGTEPTLRTFLTSPAYAALTTNPE